MRTFASSHSTRRCGISPGSTPTSRRAAQGQINSGSSEAIWSVAPEFGHVYQFIYGQNSTLIREPDGNPTDPIQQQKITRASGGAPTRRPTRIMTTTP
jgi:hypothetical protein